MNQRISLLKKNAPIIYDKLYVYKVASLKSELNGIWKEYQAKSTKPERKLKIEARGRQIKVLLKEYE